jgi:glycosyltransferase involved in cell wall biosynthesis
LNIRVGFIINTKNQGNVGVRIKKIKAALEQSYGTLEISVIYQYEDQSVLKLKKLLLSIFRNYDIIHIFEPSWPSSLFLFVFKALRIKIVYQSGDLHFSTGDLVGEKNFRYYYIKFVERFHYYFGDVCIVGSKGLKDFLVNVFLIPETKIRRLLVFTIPTEKVSFISTDSKGKNESDGISPKFIIAYSATLRIMNLCGTRVSRGWELPLILQRLRKSRLSQLKVLILGDGPGRKYLELESKKLGVGDNIIFTGRLEKNEYFDTLAKSDICFVESLDHLSYNVMDPTKVSDYLAAGKPFITGRTPESDQWWNYPLLVKPPKLTSDTCSEADDYICEIVKKIELFFLDEKFREKCYIGLQNIIEQVPSWNEIAMEVMHVYGDLV